MTKKQPPRWPIWKIGVAAGGCAVGAALLYWMSLLSQPGDSTTGVPGGRGAATTLSGFILMMAIVATILTALTLGWLAVRVWELRKPAWERRGKRRR